MCDFNLFFFFFSSDQTAHQRVRLCWRGLCSEQGRIRSCRDAPCSQLHKGDSKSLTSPLSNPVLYLAPTAHAIQFCQFYMAEHLIFLAEPAVAGTLKQPCLGRVLQERQHMPAWGPAHAVSE